MKDSQIWSKIFGDAYAYRRHERIRLVKSFKRSRGGRRIPKGSVFNIENDGGKIVGVEIAHRDWEYIPKMVIEPFPFKHFRTGQRVRVKRTIRCQGSCTEHKSRTAYCSIKAGRMGKIEEIEDFGVYHRLLHVRFKGGDEGVYEDWEAEKV